MDKAIGYIRVSTDQQAEEGVSLDAQRGRLDACKGRGRDHTGRRGMVKPRGRNNASFLKIGPSWLG